MKKLTLVCLSAILMFGLSACNNEPVSTCPDSKPLQDVFGDCFACDDESHIVTDAKKCSACPNRTKKEELCIISDCKNRPLVDRVGACYSCDTEKMPEVQKGKCSSVCPSRKENGTWSFGSKSGVNCEKIKNFHQGTF